MNKRLYFVKAENRDRYAETHPHVRKFEVRDVKLHPDRLADIEDEPWAMYRIFGSSGVTPEWSVLYGLEVRPARKKK